MRVYVCVLLYNVCVSYSPNNAVPAQWLSSIAEDPKSRSFSWAGQVSISVVACVHATVVGVCHAYSTFWADI